MKDQNNFSYNDFEQDVNNQYGDLLASFQKVKSVENFENIQQDEGIHKEFEIGDVIYLNFQFETQFDQEYQGLVMGDGISSNKLNLLLSNYAFQNNSHNQFRKCLFRIENQKKYTKAKEYYDLLLDKNDECLIEYQMKLKSFKNFKELEQQESEQTFKDQKGQVSVQYGQIIQLRHIYSNCILCVNEQQFAQQNGCIQVCLNEEGSESSFFKFVPSSKNKNKGDFIYPNDEVFLQTGDQKNQIFVHVGIEGFYQKKMTQTIQTQQLNKGVEINGSETNSKFKMKLYIEADDDHIREIKKGKYLQACDIVKIYNKKSKKVLNVELIDIEKHFQKDKKTVIIEDKSNKSDTPQLMEFECIDRDLIDSHNNNLEVKMEEMNNDNQLSCYWEIQNVELYKGKSPLVKDQFKIQHVITRQFLCVNNENQIYMSKNGNSEDCIFNFKFVNGKYDEIPYDQVKIQLNRLYMQYHKKIINICFKHKKNKKQNQNLDLKEYKIVIFILKFKKLRLFDIKLGQKQIIS